MKSKRVGVGAAALAAAVLVLGLASAPASARTATGSEVHLVRMSPDQPTAGMNNTVWFDLLNNGKPHDIQAADCKAQIDPGRRKVKLIDKGIEGTTAHCTFFIPSSAKGKSIGGYLALQSTSGTWYTAGFDRNIN